MSCNLRDPMKVEVQGLKELERNIKRSQKKLGLSAGEFADKSAQVLRDSVVRNAQPFGAGKSARVKGEKSILRDLHNCFQVVGNGSRGQKVIRSLGAAANYHRSRRNARGRVSAGQRKQITAAVFGALYQGLKAKVGMAKGSVTGGGKLNSKAQRWIKRHDDAGDGKRRKKLTGAEWTFTANPKHVASGSVLGMRGVNRAMKKHKSNLSRTLARDISRQLKREQKRLNRG